MHNHMHLLWFKFSFGLNFFQARLILIFLCLIVINHNLKQRKLKSNETGLKISNKKTTLIHNTNIQCTYWHQRLTVLRMCQDSMCSQETIMSEYSIAFCLAVLEVFCVMRPQRFSPPSPLPFQCDRCLFLLAWGLMAGLPGFASHGGTSLSRS